ncbi:protein transport protein SEC24 [Pancytospora epiphaga]|nr:protein transport protein SEC24 [Pancytospora epiphaga]
MGEVEPQQIQKAAFLGLAEELFVDQSKYDRYSTDIVPPFMSTTESLVTEQNNTDPYFIRSTFYVLPHSEYTLESTGIPLALVASPLADRGSYTEVPGFDRCTHCRAYFCSLSKYADAAYFCHICEKKSDSPLLYQNNTRYSTMEAPASSQENHLSPIFIFAIDLSFPWCNALLDSILSICQDEDFSFLYENVSFVVLNRGVTMFTKKPKFTTVRMPASAVPYIPSSMAIKTTDSESIKRIIAEIKAERVDLRETNTDSFLSILKELSKAYSGVKVAWITSARHSTLNYESLIGELKNVVINIFTPADTNKPNNLHTLSFYTSGSVFFYNSSNLTSCVVELRRTCMTRTAFNLTLILKVSDSLVKTGVISPIIEDNYSLTHLNGLDSHSSVTFLLSLSGLSKKTKYCQLQVNFIDFDGKYKTRVFNQSFPTGTPAQFYAALSADTIFTVLSKLYVAENIVPEDLLVKSLGFYKNKCSVSNAPTQFVLPDTTKMLPVLIQGFFKSIQGPLIGQNWKQRTININVESCLRIVYPRLFSISDYTTLLKTPCLPLSMNSISNLEVYILEDSYSIFVYIGHNADQQLLSCLFDPNFENILPPSSSEEALILNTAIDEIKEHYNKTMELQIIKAGKPAEAAFIGRMIEDEIDGLGDFKSYLFKLHLKVEGL